MTCCDIQDNGKIVFGAPQPPAGFSYYNSNTKELQNPTLDQRDADWHRASSAFNEKESKAIKKMLRALTPDRGSLDHSRASPSAVHPRSDVRRQSGRGSFIHGPWKQETPTPLPNWTMEDQSILIDVMKEFPKAGRDDTQLELALVKAMKKMPHKTGEECLRCFKHIQGSRIAVYID
jgi:hypothetical protein